MTYNFQQYQSVKLVAHSKSNISDVSDEGIIAYMARVSNPDNQMNNETAPKLLAYLLKHKHFSPFEMVSITLEINTTRDIGRQILRHRSFSFQEVSLRYSEASLFTNRECRIQDHKNRQNSFVTEDNNLADYWGIVQNEVQNLAYERYKEALARGVAKEQARALLPEGMVMSKLYMAGTLRSWLHYIQLRQSIETQKEHRDIALKAKAIILTELYPCLTAYLKEDI